MSVRRTLWIGAWVVGLVLLQYTVRPLLGWRVQVDFLIVALLMISVRSRPAVAAFGGFAIGVVTDALTPEAFGAGALAMTVVGFMASWLKAAFFTENLALNAIFVFAGKWVFDIAYLTASRQAPGADFAIQVFAWSPLAAALTAVVGVGVLVASRPDVKGHRR